MPEAISGKCINLCWLKTRLLKAHTIEVDFFLWLSTRWLCFKSWALLVVLPLTKFCVLLPVSLGANDNKHCYKGSTRCIRFDLKFLFFWYQSQYNILLKTLFEEEEVNHRILDCWWYKQYYTNFTCFITITSWTWWSLRGHIVAKLKEVFLEYISII